jgi:pyruvate dehydrogenase phosphatase
VVLGYCDARIHGTPVLCEGSSPKIGYATVAANQTIEDHHAMKLSESEGDYTMVCLLDGHGGPGISRLLSQTLSGSISQSLQKRCESPLTGSACIAETIRAVFESEDSRLLDLVGNISSNISITEGSCALCAVLAGDEITVANAGDSRGLLITPSVVYSSIDKLTDDPPTGSEWLNDRHTADSESEQRRLRNEHPGELDVVHCRQRIIEMDSAGEIISSRWGACYVKSRLQPTRSFGDFYLKTDAVQTLSGDLFPANFSSPYISVTPSIRTVRIGPGCFIILASDGLWDYLSPGEAVELVRAGDRSNPTALSQSLVDRALEIAAETNSISIEELRLMPPGREKRAIHDDITVIVISI